MTVARSSSGAAPSSTRRPSTVPDRDATPASPDRRREPRDRRQVAGEPGERPTGRDGRRDPKHRAAGSRPVAGPGRWSP